MKSMTGFGRSKLERNKREYTIEIKAVNHRYSDISVKMPKNISYLEDFVRKEVLANISRGKIDIIIGYTDNSTEGKNVVINESLAIMYINSLKELANKCNINKNIEVTEITKLPDVLHLKQDETQEDIIKNELDECLRLAIKSFLDMREAEGNKIKADLNIRLDRIYTIIQEISEYSTGLIEEYGVKLKERVQEVLREELIDESRIAQEIVIYSDKISIEEELTRLRSHILQFKQMLESKEAVGKKIDFLIQEMNREINTIGAKSCRLEITNCVVKAKSELEDIREQIQNIE